MKDILYKGFFRVFEYNLHRPFYWYGLYFAIAAYLLFIAYGIITPLYGTNSTLASTSLLAALAVSSAYILFSALVVLAIASALYAYIEIGRYNQQVTYLTAKRAMFEIRMPEGSFKGADSLETMETALNKAITMFEPPHWFPIWKGGRRAIFSFEIVSKGGVTSFFVNIPDDEKTNFREALHSSFINVDMAEAEDYVYDVEYDDAHTVNTLEWGFDENKGNSEERPIQSYVDMKRSEIPINPLKGLYELFASIREGEQMWVQYVVTDEKYDKADKDPDNPMKRGHWERKKLKDKIGAYISEKSDKADEPVVVIRGEPEEDKEKASPLSEEEKYFTKTAAPRLMNKRACNVGIRMVYIAPKESYDKGRIFTMMSVYGKPIEWSINKLKAKNPLLGPRFEKISHYTKKFDGPRLDKEAEQILRFRLYRDRLFWLAPALYTYQPKDSKIIRKKLKKPSKKRETMTMTVETLATLCHFPMTGDAQPSVKRALSDPLAPPPDLPIG